MDLVGSQSQTKNRDRCAACRHMRVECKSDCIFSPYFPPNDPERFTNVHRIYGASNVKSFLQKLPAHVRAQAAETLCYEAVCRIQDPVYGCVGTVSLLLQQIQSAEVELARTQAQLALLSSSAQPALPQTASSSHPGHPHHHLLRSAAAAASASAATTSSLNVVVSEQNDAVGHPATRPPNWFT